MIDASQITKMHQATVKRWHDREIDNPYEGFLALACQQHEQNYRLWHEEDVARSPTAGDTEIAEVKRRIDKLNQQRNDLIEKLDDVILAELAERRIEPADDARRNSETPGSVIDRLSILALRIYHMEEQAERQEAGREHRRKVVQRLAVLYEQLDDLAASLAELVDDLFAGRARVKVYRQFKMYNDPTLNPYLYKAASRAA